MNDQTSSRRILTGSVQVSPSPEQAIRLFTPEGERSWVPDWVPIYPDSGTTDDSEPGVVWQTQRDEGTVTWVVADRQDAIRRYVFVLPGVVAGTVAVECVPRPGGSVAHVSYDVTALGAEGVGYLENLATGFDEEMETWATQIEAAVSRGIA